MKVTKLFMIMAAAFAFLTLSLPINSYAESIGIEKRNVTKTHSKPYKQAPGNDDYVNLKKNKDKQRKVRQKRKAK